MSSAEPSDDQSILDTEILWRRVLPNQVHYVDFKSRTTKEYCLAMAPSKMYLAEFSVGTVRNAGCGVIRDPLEGNPAHALVCGNHRHGGPTNGQAKKISKNAIILDFEISPKNE